MGGLVLGLCRVVLSGKLQTEVNEPLLERLGIASCLVPDLTFIHKIRCSVQWKKNNFSDSNHDPPGCDHTDKQMVMGEYTYGSSIRVNSDTEGLMDTGLAC